MNAKPQKVALSAATPGEWARSYADATHAMDAAAIAALASAHITVFHKNSAPQRTIGAAQMGEEMGGAYSAFKSSGKTIAAIDYSITQTSDDFASVRFTWETGEAKIGAVMLRINSTYLLRREEHGWRFIGILEQGVPSGPN